MPSAGMAVYLHFHRAVCSKEQTDRAGALPVAGGISLQGVQGEQLVASGQSYYTACASATVCPLDIPDHRFSTVVLLLNIWCYVIPKLGVTNHHEFYVKPPLQPLIFWNDQHSLRCACRAASRPTGTVRRVWTCLGTGWRMMLEPARSAARCHQIRSSRASILPRFGRGWYVRRLSEKPSPR
jgi:hypothetical protein